LRPPLSSTNARRAKRPAYLAARLAISLSSPTPSDRLLEIGYATGTATVPLLVGAFVPVDPDG